MREIFVRNKKNIPAHAWNSVVNELNLKNIIYVDLNSSPEKKCDYFMDLTHMGYQCFAEAFLIELNRLH